MTDKKDVRIGIKTEGAESAAKSAERVVKAFDPSRALKAWETGLSKIERRFQELSKTFESAAAKLKPRYSGRRHGQAIAQLGQALEYADPRLVPKSRGIAEQTIEARDLGARARGLLSLEAANARAYGRVPIKTSMLGQEAVDIYQSTEAARARASMNTVEARAQRNRESADARAARTRENSERRVASMAVREGITRRGENARERLAEIESRFRHGSRFSKEATDRYLGRRAAQERRVDAASNRAHGMELDAFEDRLQGSIAGERRGDRSTTRLLASQFAEARRMKRELGYGFGAMGAGIMSGNPLAGMGGGLYAGRSMMQIGAGLGGFGGAAMMGGGAVMGAVGGAGATFVNLFKRGLQQTGRAADYRRLVQNSLFFDPTRMPGAHRDASMTQTMRLGQLFGRSAEDMMGLAGQWQGASGGFLNFNQNKLDAGRGSASRMLRDLALGAGPFRIDMAAAGTLDRARRRGGFRMGRGPETSAEQVVMSGWRNGLAAPEIRELVSSMAGRAAQSMATGVMGNGRGLLEMGAGLKGSIGFTQGMRVAGETANFTQAIAQHGIGGASSPGLGLIALQAFGGLQLGKGGISASAVWEARKRMEKDGPTAGGLQRLMQMSMDIGQGDRGVGLTVASRLLGEMGINAGPEMVEGLASGRRTGWSRGKQSRSEVLPGTSMMAATDAKLVNAAEISNTMLRAGDLMLRTAQLLQGVVSMLTGSQAKMTGNAIEAGLRAILPSDLPGSHGGVPP